MSNSLLIQARGIAVANPSVPRRKGPLDVIQLLLGFLKTLFTAHFEGHSRYADRSLFSQRSFEHLTKKEHEQLAKQGDALVARLLLESAADHIRKV